MAYASLYNFSCFFRAEYSVSTLINKHSEILYVRNSDYIQRPEHPVNAVFHLRDFVGQLLYDDNFIATAFVIANHCIITARHAVNLCQLKGLSYQHTKNNKRYALEVLEDGSDIQQDYIIFRLISLVKPPVTPIIPPLNIERTTPLNGEHLVLLGHAPRKFHIGHQQTAVMGMASYMGGYSPLNLYTNALTKNGYSGAPYINSKHYVVGLHLKRASEATIPGERTGLLFTTLIDSCGTINAVTSEFLTLYYYATPKNKESIAYRFSAIPMCRDDMFDEFSTTVPGFLEYEEGDKRKHLFGNTPGLKSGTGIRVLQRSEQQGTAQYLGNKAGAEKYKDHANWHVQLRKTETGPLQWIALNTVDPQKPGKAGVQMGHILSVAEYWEQGDPASAKYSVAAKSRWNGKANKKTFSKDVARPFMTDSDNYQFEWCRLNEANGAAGHVFNAPAGYQWGKNHKKKWELS